MLKLSTQARPIPEICAGLSKIASSHYVERKHGSTATVTDILHSLEQFQECVRYLNTRRSKGAVLSLESEADVQDALYLMLRPWLTDIVSENPTNRIANKFSIKDFIIPSAKTVIEIKYVRDKQHGRGISSEIHDDIEIYRHHPQCEHLVFFVYDVDSQIPDSEQLRKQIEEERIYAGRRLHCHAIIKP